MMLTCLKETGVNAGRLSRQDAGRLVLWQRISVPELDERSWA
jgi:hypothetical protein